MISDLPAPVQRWLIYFGVVGREEIKTAYLKQSGEMKINPRQDKWIKSVADQSFNAIQPYKYMGSIINQHLKSVKMI